MLIRMVPHSVMLGFVNGLAIVIFMAQFGSFKTVDAAGRLAYMRGPALWIMLGLVALTMAIIWLLPKLTRAVPASLAAILVVTARSRRAVNRYARARSSPRRIRQHVVLTVGDMLLPTPKARRRRADRRQRRATAQRRSRRGLGGDRVGRPVVGRASAAGLPRPVLPRLRHCRRSRCSTLWIILPYALMLAAVGLIESLMTLTLVDEITETRGQGNRECIGQGLANVVCGFFGGMGGCAMIGQSLINVNSGGRGRLSGIVAAVCLLLFVLFLAPWIEMIPMAALVGVMFMVVIGTFEWATLRMFAQGARRRLPGHGARRRLHRHHARPGHGGDPRRHRRRPWSLPGSTPSTSASTSSSTSSAARSTSCTARCSSPRSHRSKTCSIPKNDPDDVVIDFYYTRVYDQSGLEAINALAEKYEQCGKRLHLTHLSPECRHLLDRAGDSRRGQSLRRPAIPRRHRTIGLTQRPVRA